MVDITRFETVYWTAFFLFAIVQVLALGFIMWCAWQLRAMRLKGWRPGTSKPHGIDELPKEFISHGN